MKKSLFLLSFIVLLTSFSSISQDVIILRDGKKIDAVITQIKEDEIAYKFYGRDDQLTIVTNTAKINKIKFQNGTTMEFKKEVSDDVVYFTQDHRNILKTPFLSIPTGILRIDYERAFSIKSSYQVGLGILGLGDDDRDVELSSANSGVEASGGYKVKILFSNSYTKHAMTGLYFMPRAKIGFANVNIYSFSSNTETYNAKFGSLDLLAGYQVVINNRFVLDFGALIGVGGVTKPESVGPNDGFYPEISLGLGHQIIDGFSSGLYLSIGYNFGDKFESRKKRKK